MILFNTKYRVNKLCTTLDHVQCSPNSNIRLRDGGGTFLLFPCAQANARPHANFRKPKLLEAVDSPRRHCRDQQFYNLQRRANRKAKQPLAPDQRKSFAWFSGFHVFAHSWSRRSMTPVFDIHGMLITFVFCLLVSQTKDLRNFPVPYGVQGFEAWRTVSIIIRDVAELLGCLKWPC